ncbi:hypothetical protein F4604DRAFT_1923128 [Suillus subluteus]|nr:hypothetical protein F4604DRAFT_1923128 [Suillus subluteus]
MAPFTQPSNKNAHPGLLDAPIRSRKQKVNEGSKQSCAAAKANALNNVAEIEREMEEEDSHEQQYSACPPVSSVKKVTRPAPRPVTRPAPRPVTRPAPRPVTCPAPRPVTCPAPRPVSRQVIVQKEQGNEATQDQSNNATNSKKKRTPRELVADACNELGVTSGDRDDEQTRITDKIAQAVLVSKHGRLGLVMSDEDEERMQVPNSRLPSGSAPPAFKGIQKHPSESSKKEISKEGTHAVRFGGLEDEDELAEEDNREPSLQLVYSDPLDMLENAGDEAGGAQHELDDGGNQGDQDKDGDEVNEEQNSGVNNETVQQASADRRRNGEPNDHNNNKVNTSHPTTTDEDHRSKPSQGNRTQQVRPNTHSRPHEFTPQEAHVTSSRTNTYSRPPQSTQQGARTTSETHRPNKRNVRPLDQPPVMKVVPRNTNTNEGGKKHSQRRKFCTEDLPDGSQQRFRLELTPLWIDYISTLEGPWDASDYADKNDPVYALLMQHAYNYRSGFADRAELAVASYLEHKTPDNIKEIVEYLAPSILELPGNNGKTHYINPGCYPYLWKDVDMVYDDQGNFSHANASGAFLHELISDTFAHHLEAIQGLSEASQMKDCPRGALALTCVGVERALRMYSTGEYVKPDAAIEARFSQQLWGVTTDEIMLSITKTTPRGWKNIIKAAIPYIGAYKSHATSHSALKEQREGPNGYVACFDRDSASNSGSDFSF